MSGEEIRPLIRKNLGLNELLQLASPDELMEIAGVLIGEENDRFLGGKDARSIISEHRQAGTLYRAVDSISYEVRALGSNGVASFFRGGEPVSYDEVVRDVAKELKVTFSKDEGVADVEMRILEKLSGLLLQEDKDSGALKATPPVYSVAKAGVLSFGVVAPTFFPVAALVAYGAYAVLDRVKDRPELQGLTKVVIRIAQIRKDVVDTDHEDFVERLRACL